MRACYISVIKNIHVWNLNMHTYNNQKHISNTFIYSLVLFTLNCIMGHALLISFNNYRLKYDLFFDNDVRKILVQVSKKIFSMNVSKNKVKS